ncbi:MAG TPA: GNAT family N-acetyltransferase [Chloroflexia bacterium]|nr:GNAT family N-acetyltransferase [Chloroflexia bacterium]
MDPDRPLIASPPIAGLRFRRFAGETDFPVLLEVRNSSKRADGLDDDLHTLERFVHTYRRTPGYEPERDLLIAEVGGEVVAYSRLLADRELDGTCVYWHDGFVLPGWRGRGLGGALIGWAEAHAASLAAAAGETGPVVASTETRETQTGLIGLLKGLGYHPVRYWFPMETADLDHIPHAPLPPGLELRPAQPEHYRAIWEAMLEAVRDHWGFSESEEQDFDGWLAHPFRQPALWVVAWDGDQVAGSILNYVDLDYNASTGRRVGYTENITVRRPWRRRGLARAMLAHSMAMHKARGMTQTHLGVDTDNPSGALTLYQSMGYRATGQETTYRKRLGPQILEPGRAG